MSDRHLQEMIELFDSLSDVGKLHVLAILRSLDRGWTGTIRLECTQGGIGTHVQSKDIAGEIREELRNGGGG